MFSPRGLDGMVAHRKLGVKVLQLISQIAIHAVIYSGGGSLQVHKTSIVGEARRDPIWEIQNRDVHRGHVGSLR